jgi:predicted Zn-dependent protease
VLPDMLMERYVNQLGRWISLQSTRPNLPWTFAVLDDPGFNAFAAPGGYIYVTKGLIDRVADEAEVAGILAHEIVHVTSKHHLIALNKAARAGLLTQAISSQFWAATCTPRAWTKATSWRLTAAVWRWRHAPGLTRMVWWLFCSSCAPPHLTMRCLRCH